MVIKENQKKLGQLKFSLFLLICLLLTILVESCSEMSIPIDVAKPEPEKPQIVQTDTIYTSDKKIFGDSVLVKNVDYDQSAILQRCINLASAKNKKLLIESGIYQINKNITMPSNSTILGSFKSPSILRNSTSNEVILDVNKGINTNKKNIKIAGLFLDGIGVYTWLLDGFIFTDNVIYNPKLQFVVSLNAGKNHKLRNNVFMRDVTHTKPGDFSRSVLANGFVNKDRYVFMDNFDASNNLFGLKFSEIDKLKAIASDSLALTVNRVKNAEVAGILKAGANEQNYFTTCINSFYMLRGATIKTNIFYAHSENANMAGVDRDHITYLRGSQDVEIVANYARGFHNGVAGSFKFKSGKNISIINNYLRNTGIIFYTTAEYGYSDTYETSRKSVLENIMVYGNIFDFKYFENSYRLGIEYNDEASTGVGKNGVFMNNVYKNYSNIPASIRQLILLNSLNGVSTETGFKPDNTFVKDNTRDDVADKKLLVYHWTEADYVSMPKKYSDVYVPKNFETNKQIIAKYIAE